MNKKDNVTERLIEISDRLKKQTGAMPAVPEDAVPTYAVLPSTPEAPMKEDSAQARRIADGERAKRDLTGRLARDQATLEIEIGALDSRRQSLREIEKALSEQLGKLESITPDASGITFAKEVDNARLDYFRLVGRREAMSPPEAKGAAAAEPPTAKERIVHGIFDTLLPAAAILAAALLVAGAILFVFR